MKKNEQTSLSFILVKSYPKGWQEFWEPIYSLSRDFGIDVNVALEILRLTYECVSKEEEGKPISTGFLIGELDRIKERLTESVGMRIDKQNIQSMAKAIRPFFGLIDGYASVFVIGKEGLLQDARLMPEAAGVPDESSLTSNEFHAYCDASRGIGGYGLVALGSSKTVKLFSDGCLKAEVYFSGKVGQWTCRSLSDVLELLDQIASRKGMAPKILYKIFGTAINMSNHRKGGTIVVGDPEKVLDQSESPRLIFSGKNVLELKGHQEKHLYNLATQEFALLVSREGELKASSVRLLARVPNGTNVELTPMDGGRHRSAAEISASTNSVAFVVSDDGPITIYSEGKRILRE